MRTRNLFSRQTRTSQLTTPVLSLEFGSAIASGVVMRARVRLGESLRTGRVHHAGARLDLEG